jgi:hypothetical protein
MRSMLSLYKTLWKLFKGFVSRKTSFKAVQQLKTLLYLESVIIVCYSYINLKL